MATRGRESNMLYVDTMYDPDTPTAHETRMPLDPSEILERVIAHPGADLSAHEMRKGQHDVRVDLARAEAEGAAILAVHRARRGTSLRANSLLDREV